MNIVNRFIDSCNNLPELDGVSLWETFLCPEMMHVVVEKNGQKEWFSQKYEDIEFEEMRKMKEKHPVNIRKRLGRKSKI